MCSVLCPSRINGLCVLAVWHSYCYSRDMAGRPANNGIEDMDTASKHQMRVAKDTLRMTPAMARIMGGMDYPTAYEHVFRTDLKTRLQSLCEQYGDAAAKPFDDGGVSWELGKYGYTPAELLKLL